MERRARYYINGNRLIEFMGESLSIFGYTRFTQRPRWYKFSKIFILLGFLVGYWYLFGYLKTAVFIAIFIFLSFMVHLTYLLKTDKFKPGWLDFVVVEKGN